MDMGGVSKTGRLSNLHAGLLTLAAISLFLGNVAPAQTEPGTGPEPAPVLLLLKDPTSILYSLSPDGRSIAIVDRSSAGYFLIVRSTEDGSPQPEVFLGRNKPSGITWLGPERLIYQTEGRLVATNIDGSDHAMLLDYVDDENRYSFNRRHYHFWSIAHLLPDDPEHILVQSRNGRQEVEVIKLNVYTGKQDIVVSEPKLKIDYWLVDRLGEVRLAVRFKKDTAEILAHDKPTGKWLVYDNYSENADNTLGFTGKTFLTNRISLEEFDYDNRHIYMATNRESDRFRLVKYDLESRRIVEEIYASDEYDVGGPTTDAASLLFLDSEKRVIGVSVVEETVKKVWLDDRFKAYQETLDLAYPNTRNLIQQWSSDGKILLVFSHSDVDPGRVWIFRPDESRVLKFTELNKALNEKTLSNTEIIHFPARDGYELEGYLNLPTNHSDNPAALVVMPHGGPWARDDWDFNPWVQYFATRGYAVLRVNYRGSTGYGREHVLAGVKNIDTLMIDDIADGTRWAVTNSLADPESTFIFGHSYGGYAALMSTVRYPNLYKAAVSWSAPLDLPDLLKYYDKEDYYFAYEFWKTAIGHPRTEKQALRRISPHYRIDDLSTPIIAFHGELDRIIPVKQMESFEKALKKKSKSVEVSIIDGEGHTFSNKNNIAYVLDKAQRFFDQHR
jgi:dipeptidyl aminopeptidase/acylaminoacyl peptidase